VPVQPLALVTEETLYVVAALGETLRVAVFVFAVWTKPSDHVRVNGSPVPLMVAVTVAEPPVQIAPPPETVTVTGAEGVTVAEPLVLPLQLFALRIEVTE
jgi:hypothetical protein